MKAGGAVVAGVLATALILAASGLSATPYDNFVLLADAFRHGRVWIDWPGAYIDAISYAGRYYVIEAPLPAVLLLPAAFVRSSAMDQSLLSAVLGGVATFAAWEIAREIGVAPRTRAVLCGFLLLGTDLFWCAMLGDVWFIAHVASVACTLLALREVLGRRRGWLVALFAACAVESRFSLVLAVPVYAALVAYGPGLRPAPGDGRRPRYRALASFAATLVPFVLLWVAYNELRWGRPFDAGYSMWYHQDSAGLPSGSPFRLMYVPQQLYSFFVRAPERVAGYPFLVPSIAGVALIWTSPALIYACFARVPRRLVAALWLATALTAAPNLLYYVNGYAQFGMRHALDFEPFLFVLMALALRDGIGPLAAALCGYSMVAGAWGCWYWRTFIRH